jgi:hypothetical protein
MYLREKEIHNQQLPYGRPPLDVMSKITGCHLVLMCFPIKYALAFGLPSSLNENFYKASFEGHLQ